MFCEKCGKEISKHEVCGSEVGAGASHSHYDKNTREEWFQVYVEYFRCKRGHEKIIWTKWQIKMKFPTCRLKWGEVYVLVLKKHLKDNFLNMGTCKSVCCPHCGVIK